MDRTPLTGGTKALMGFVGLSFMLLIVSVIYAGSAITTTLAANHDQAIAGRERMVNTVKDATTYREDRDQVRHAEEMEALGRIEGEIKKGS